jgi:hypothetical protein
MTSGRFDPDRTGSDRLSRTVRPVLAAPLLVRSCIFTRDVLGFRLLIGHELPSLFIKGHGRLRVCNRSKTYQSITSSLWRLRTL